MLPFVENRRIVVEQGVRRWGWLLHNAVQIARLYLRVSTDEQDLARQADIEHSARQAGYYIAGIYREKANTRSWTAR